MLRKLLLLWLLTAVPTLADGPPKIFQNLDFATATSRAKEQGRWLLVDATASWCPPCHRMDATTWVDPALVEYAEKSLVAIQIDVDEQAELAEKLQIDAMPTVIIFGPDGELDRSVGYKTSEELLAWLTDLQQGKTETARLQEKAASGDIESRFDLAGNLLKSGRVAEAEKLYLQLWTDMAEDPSWAGVRYSYLLTDLEKLVEQSPTARVGLEAMRDQAKEKGNLEDWFFLSLPLGHQDELLAWEPTKPVPERIQRVLFQYLIERDEWARAGALIDDPAARARSILKLRAVAMESLPEEMKEEFAEYADQQANDDLVNLYRACLAASRSSEASAVRDVALEHNQALKAAFDEVDNSKGLPSP